MKQFFQRNGIQILSSVIVLVVLIIGVAITWGQTETKVEHNTGAIIEVKGDVKVLQTESVTSQVQYGRIETRLDNIEGLLIKILDK